MTEIAPNNYGLRMFNLNQNCAIAALRFQIATLRAELLSIKRNFDPDQPRAPAGLPNGGQWPKIPNAGNPSARSPNRQRIAQATDRFGNPLIDLHREEAKGGHTISRHVGKSREWLVNRIVQNQATLVPFTVGIYRAGSFSSLEAATKLIRSTIAQNRSLIEARLKSAPNKQLEFVSTFRTPTGIEAYLPNTERNRPRLFRPKQVHPVVRPTYSVHVVLRPYPNSPSGYRLVTAFPKEK